MVHADVEGIAELVEIDRGQGGEPRPPPHGIKLTYRLMDDVVADLERAGFHGIPDNDIGWEYDEGLMHLVDGLPPGR